MSANDELITAAEAAVILGLRTAGGARSTLSKNSVRSVDRVGRRGTALYRAVEVRAINHRRGRGRTNNRDNLTEAA